ncbi:MAG: hypothetical protein HYY44_09815 [Deltaproteobacteria bacterium]|nr:hypothetical protein [Deltaproteobacteria bacterium]
MTQIGLIRILQRLAKNRKRVFTLREVATLAGVSRPAAGMTLLRAEKNGLVSRSANEWINLMDPPKLEEVALAVASPSYISFESALYHHGVISQSPRGYLSVAVQGRPRELITPLGKIRLIHLQPSLFFGFDTHRIASPEKAWLDLLYIRGLRGRKKVISEEVYRNRLNRKRLRLLEKEFPIWVQELNRKVL